MHWLDPDYLPELSGTFECFLLNPHGDADGMILSDGTEVHFPPHLSDDVRAAIPPGAKPKVTIRGVRARGGELIAAVAIDLPDGTRILDNGPEKDRDSKKRRVNTHPRSNTTRCTPKASSVVYFTARKARPGACCSRTESPSAFRPTKQSVSRACSLRARKSRFAVTDWNRRSAPSSRHESSVRPRMTSML